jgi:hypothetical protein
VCASGEFDCMFTMTGDIASERMIGIVRTASYLRQRRQLERGERGRVAEDARRGVVRRHVCGRGSVCNCHVRARGAGRAIGDALALVAVWRCCFRFAFDGVRRLWSLWFGAANDSLCESRRAVRKRNLNRAGAREAKAPKFLRRRSQSSVCRDSLLDFYWTAAAAVPCSAGKCRLNEWKQSKLHLIPIRSLNSRATALHFRAYFVCAFSAFSASYLACHRVFYGSTRWHLPFCTDCTFSSVVLPPPPPLGPSPRPRGDGPRLSAEWTYHSLCI